MKKWIRMLFIGVIFLGVLSACSSSSQDLTRWYTAEQVTIGKPLFSKHCSGCHGSDGQGGQGWKKALPNGSYPPQPLNGTGHSWHHPLAQLEATIESGGKHPGATMPGFGGVLNEREILAVISAFQDYWDAGTYKAWIKRGGLSQ